MYIYDAVGTKLRKTVSGITTDYAGNYIYENGVLQFFNTAEGYAEPVSTGSTAFKYVYQYKDHLGNIRLSYKDISTTSTPVLQILEENNYYPFGLKHKGYNNVVNGTEHNYQTFQGQEEEKELGKNIYAFQWRDYDPAIARFNKIDRFAEKYVSHSPYAFTKNNPIKFSEIKGDSIWISFGKNNQNRVLYQDGQLLNADGTTYTGDGVKVRKDGSVKVTNSFLRQTTKALGKIADAEKELGTNVVSALQDSKNNFTISHAKFNPDHPGKNEFKSSDHNAAFAVAMFDEGVGNPKPFGSGGNIFWNPTSGSVQELGGGIGMRPTTNLSHELFHGYDANFGKLDNRPSGSGLRTDKGRASFFENQIRTQLGYPLREFYNQFRLLNGSNSPIKVSPPSVIWLEE